MIDSCSMLEDDVELLVNRNPIISVPEFNQLLDNSILSNDFNIKLMDNSLFDEIDLNPFKNIDRYIDVTLELPAAPIIVKMEEKKPEGLMINPYQLHFIPRSQWKDEEVPFHRLLMSHFRAHSTRKLRFEHKLWNALILSLYYPLMYRCIGVRWVNNSVIEVNKKVFSALLGIKKATTALFNRTGSFNSHGFVELEDEDLAPEMRSPEIRYFRHGDGIFTCNALENAILKCKWHEAV